VTDEANLPTAVVRRQTEAYSEGDPDAFAACFHEEAVVARLGDDEPVARGRAAIREYYGELFEAVPDLDCTVVDEFGVGEFVACKERVTGTGEPIDALAVYRVVDGLITRLWLGE